jgi:hypothetical protein
VTAPWWRSGDRGPTSAELRAHVLEHEENELARQALAAMPAEQRAELERVSAIARAHHEGDE